MATPSPTRAPDGEVRRLHSVPRYWGEDRRFSADSNFAFASRDVAQSLAVGMFALMMLYFIYSLCRRLFWLCQRPTRSVSSRGARWQRRLLVLWVLVAVFASLYTIVGERRISKGAKQLVDDIGDVGGIFDSLEAGANALLDDADALDASLILLTCKDDRVNTFLGEGIQDFRAQAIDALNQVAGLGADMRDNSDRVEGVRDYFFYALLGIIFIVALLLIPQCVGDTTLCCATSGLSGASKYASVVLTFAAALAIAEWAISVKVADFCVRPDANFLLVASKQLKASTYDQVAYYVDCAGANPVWEAIDAAIDAVADLKSAVANNAGGCTPQSALDGMAKTCDSALSTLSAMRLEASCSVLHALYQSVVQTTVCRTVAGAVPRLAVAHSAVAALLYVYLYLANWVVETLSLVEEKMFTSDFNSLLRENPRRPLSGGAAAAADGAPSAGRPRAQSRTVEFTPPPQPQPQPTAQPTRAQSPQAQPPRTQQPRAAQSPRAQPPRAAPQPPTAPPRAAAPVRGTRRGPLLRPQLRPRMEFASTTVRISLDASDGEAPHGAISL
ncbi:hypothetical protein M885DRAFT_552325 [Pelagophyceae sp. CCMP2097]|nr:hypothetical protein M885DRAFT_552325 [Pelagophyceae sp. CCMP2097]